MHTSVVALLKFQEWHLLTPSPPALSFPYLPPDIVFGQPASNVSTCDRGGSSQALNLEGDEAPPSLSQQLRASRPAPATGSSDKESLWERIRAVIT